MQPLWIASNNEKKRAELERLLSGLGYELHLQSEAVDAPDVVEDRPDFAGNAELKARSLARVVGAAAVGDDSGLCVDALDGRPGVRSARYATGSDADRYGKLLSELIDTPPERRSARFVCHICLAGPDGEVLTRVEGACEGVIIEAPRGAEGFGYDPVFVAAAHGSADSAPTFAELSATEKDAVSHRGAALRQLANFLQQHSP